MPQTLIYMPIITLLIIQLHTNSMVAILATIHQVLIISKRKQAFLLLAKPAIHLSVGLLMKEAKN